MSYNTITLTLNNSAVTNVSYTIATSDYQDAVSQTQAIMKNGGLWTNTSVGGPLNTFYPASAVLYVTVS